MKYIKLFEDFEHTPKESMEIEDRYNKILNEKAVSIVAQRPSTFNDIKELVLLPTVRVWSGHNNLNEDLSYSLEFRMDGDSSEMVSLSIYNGGQKISAWKDGWIYLESSEISKILRMVDDASDYIGGIDLNKVEKELMEKLTTKRT